MNQNILKRVGIGISIEYTLKFVRWEAFYSHWKQSAYKERLKEKAFILSNKTAMG